ncbi:MAG: glycosyltransferase [Nitrosomonadales bacterium]|nr:glycosyltransferase [Nitrosomonadales bacterium]
MAAENMTGSNPTISVCIANYNGMEVIDDCLRSVLEQEGHIPLEILVHDDASDDGSVKYIRNSYPDVILIESQENVGFCIANNRMAAAARGKYLLLLNNDAALNPDALQTLLSEANRFDQPAILGLPQYDFDSGELLDIGSLFDPFLNPVPNMNPERNEVGMVIGACLWIPKELWQELGGFPEWFGSIGEDLYLCCLARLAGYPVRAMGISGYRHRVGTSFGGGKVRGEKLATTFRRRALSERNKTFVMVICYPGILLIWLLPLHLVMIHLEGLLLSLIKWDSAVWNKIYAPLLPALWRQRQRLLSLRLSSQSLRKVSLRSWLAPFCLTPWKLKMLVRHGLPNLT